MKKSILQDIIDTTPLVIKKLVEKQGEIAAQVSKILKERNIKQKEFAKKLSMKESQLSKILAGNANLTLKTITKIEAELGVDIIKVPMFNKESVTIIHKIEISDLKSYSHGHYSSKNDLLLPHTTDVHRHMEIKTFNKKRFAA